MRLLIFLVIFLTGCSVFEKKIYITKYKTVYKIPTELNKIDKPELKVLNEKESYCSVDNIDKQLKNLNELIVYIESLENKVSKYEEDIKKLKSEKEKADVQ